MCMSLWMNMFVSLFIWVCMCSCVWKREKGGVVAVTRHRGKCTKGGLGAVSSREEKREWPDGPQRGIWICRMDQWKYSKGQMKTNDRSVDLSGTWFPSFSCLPIHSVTPLSLRHDDIVNLEKTHSQQKCSVIGELITLAKWVPQRSKVRGQYLDCVSIWKINNEESTVTHPHTQMCVQRQ